MNLDQIESTAKAATPGPWKSKHRAGNDAMYRTEIYSDTHGGIATCDWTPKNLGNGVTETYREANAQLIANMDPQSALRLVAIARAARRVMSPGGYSRNDWAALRDALEGVE